jgi:hypothetical protein
MAYYHPAPAAVDGLADESAGGGSSGRDGPWAWVCPPSLMPAWVTAVMQQQPPHQQEAIWGALACARVREMAGGGDDRAVAGK